MDKFIKIERWMLESIGAKSDTFILAILRGFDDGMRVHPSHEWLSNRLHITIAAVNRAINRLVKDGYMEITKTGKHRTVNEYTVSGKADEAAAAWSSRNELAQPKLPPFLQVYDWMVCGLGTTAQCILYANLYALQSANDGKSYEESIPLCHYGQKQLAIMCGCTERQIRFALYGTPKKDGSGNAAGWSDIGLIRKKAVYAYETNWTWKKSRHEYEVNTDFQFSTFMQEIYSKINVENNMEEKSINSNTGIEEKSINSKCGVEEKSINSKPLRRKKVLAYKRIVFIRESFLPNKKFSMLIREAFSRRNAMQSPKAETGGKKQNPDSASNLFPESAKPKRSESAYLTDSQLSEQRVMRSMRNESVLAQWGAEISAEKAIQSGEERHHDDGSKETIRVNPYTGLPEMINQNDSDELPF